MIHPDDVYLRILVEMFALWWDGEVLDLCSQSNDNALLVLSADIVSIDDAFVINLITENSSCPYFADE